MITVKLKKGIKFSPPVNREITSKDIKYGFERAFSSHVPSPTPPSTSTTSSGAEQARRIKDIPGIETPDDSTIVFKLKRPSAALVPGAGHAHLDAGATGVRQQVRRQDAVDLRPVRRLHRPVHVQERQLGQGRRAQAGRSIELVRNPNWDPKTDYRPAYLDAITTRRATTTPSPRRGASSRARPWSRATARTPAPVIKQALSRNKDQIAFIPGGGYRTIAMNSTIKPFDNINVRKAVVAASTARPCSSRAAAPRPATWRRTSCRRRSPASTTRAAPRAGRSTSWPTRAATWRWPRSTCSRPRSRTRACRSTPAACGPARTSCSWWPATPTRARRPARSRRPSSRRSASRSTSAPRRRTPSTRSTATSPRRRS